ncbi:MAG TPA: hypothetical protein VFC56_15165 [Stellaceae bacterium]|nr:hypothetical protein [Stellaceae bacterium]
MPIEPVSVISPANVAPFRKYKVLSSKVLQLPAYKRQYYGLIGVRSAKFLLLARVAFARSI